MNNSITSNIFKDYTLKIQNKSLFSDKNIDTKLVSVDINNLVVYLNFCFNKKNNFFVPAFNVKNIYPVYLCYNQIKSNILSKELFSTETDFFSGIDKMNIKTLKFILYYYINNFTEISNNKDNEEICLKIEKDSIRNCINYLTKYYEI